jgi:hypothetical protein
MYDALTFGNSAGTNPVLGNLNNALFRMSAIGATSLLVPGPKMIWHFGELGMNNSIWTCNNGVVNSDYDNNNPAGDCKLDTKPQPQWVNNWLAVPERAKIYNDWSKMIDLKRNNPVFKGDYTISTDGSNVRQRIYVFDNSLPASQLKNVVILANFSVASQGINPNFPYTGTWVNLMDNTTINVTNTSTAVTIESGGFRIYGNQAALGTNDFQATSEITLFPNPSSNFFNLSQDVAKADVYSVTGQLVKSFGTQFSNYNYSISDLVNGIYVVKVTGTDGRLQSLKLIKN